MILLAFAMLVAAPQDLRECLPEALNPQGLNDDFPAQHCDSVGTLPPPTSPVSPNDPIVKWGFAKLQPDERT